MRAPIATTLALVGCAGASGYHAVDVPDVPPTAAATSTVSSPQGDVEASQAISIEPRNVTLAIAMGALRTHPVGQKLGPIIAAIPQWRNLVDGVITDPVHDVDWVYMTGLDFTRAAKSAILVRYALSDAVFDARVRTLVQRSPSSVALDLGVQGAKATLATFGSDASRVVIRAQPSFVALAPEGFAHATATTLATHRILAPFEAPEALRVSVKDPHRTMGALPATISVVDLRITASDDGGAVVAADGACADAADATAAADTMRALIQKSNGMVVRMMTHNILGGATVTAVGSHVEIRVTPNQDQLDATVRILGSLMGVDMTATKGPASH